MGPDARPWADLHVHTTASDGLAPPEAVVRIAAGRGIRVLAITDHDTADGTAAAVSAGAQRGITVVPGIELSCGLGEEVHLLGYGLDESRPAVRAFLRAQRDSRRARMLAMLERLRAVGMDISPGEAAGAGGAFLGRLPLADVLVRKGYVRDTREAFARYLGEGKPAFVPRKRPAVLDAAQALTSFGAVAVLAHPGRLRMEEGRLLSLLPAWQEAGLCGMEAYHTSHSDTQCIRYDAMARARGLLVTGGSDSHERDGGPNIGDGLHRWKQMDTDVAAWMERVHRAG